MLLSISSLNVIISVPNSRKKERRHDGKTSSCDLSSLNQDESLGIEWHSLLLPFPGNILVVRGDLSVVFVEVLATVVCLRVAWPHSEVVAVSPPPGRHAFREPNRNNKKYGCLMGPCFLTQYTMMIVNLFKNQEPFDYEWKYCSLGTGTVPLLQYNH